jgi:hypothetical protein
MSYGVIDEISARMFNRARTRDRLHEIGETCAKTGGISGEIIGTSGTIGKTGVETGETYGTTWLAAKATAVKHPDRQAKPATAEVVAGFVMEKS